MLCVCHSMRAWMSSFQEKNKTEALAQVQAGRQRPFEALIIIAMAILGLREGGGALQSSQVLPMITLAMMERSHCLGWNDRTAFDES